MTERDAFSSGEGDAFRHGESSHDSGGRPVTPEDKMQRTLGRRRPRVSKSGSLWRGRVLK